jgi:hypothetical protein
MIDLQTKTRDSLNKAINEFGSEADAISLYVIGMGWLWALTPLVLLFVTILMQGFGPICMFVVHIVYFIVFKVKIDSLPYLLSLLVNNLSVSGNIKAWNACANSQDKVDPMFLQKTAEIIVNSITFSQGVVIAYMVLYCCLSFCACIGVCFIFKNDPEVDCTSICDNLRRSKKTKKKTESDFSDVIIYETEK